MDRKHSFKGWTAAGLEHFIRESDRLGRQAAPLLLKRLAREPGAKQRAADWKRRVKEDMEKMKAAHDSGDSLAAYHALQFCSDIGMATPLWASGRIIADTRKRIAGKRKRTVQQQAIFEMMCFESFKQLHRGGEGLSKNAAWKEIGKWFNLSSGAIRAACDKAASNKKGKPVL